MAADTVYVFVIADRRRGTLFAGTASDLAARCGGIRRELCAEFSARPSSGLLLWYEAFPGQAAAEACLRDIRKLRWADLVRFLETVNPGWTDRRLP